MKSNSSFLSYCLFLFIFLGKCGDDDPGAPVGSAGAIQGNWAGNLFQDIGTGVPVTLKIGSQRRFSMTSSSNNQQASGIYNHFVSSKVLVFDVKESTFENFEVGVSTYDYELNNGELLLSTNSDRFLLKKVETKGPILGPEGDWFCRDAQGNNWHLGLEINEFKLLVTEDNNPAIIIKGRVESNRKPDAAITRKLIVEQSRPEVAFAYILVDEGSEENSEPRIDLIPHDLEGRPLDKLTPVPCQPL